jgi:SAM-dependent MidA family methyltransferase
LSETAEKIAAEIGKKGAIPFAQFMAHALYCPNCGYYEREEDIIGRQGDYYTGVSVGSLFGELLALRFAEWLEPLPSAQLVEAGAHDGTLAKDILSWLRRHRPALMERLEYCIAEPSERRQAWQRRTLAEFAGKVRWVKDVAELQPVRGVIFCNELLDALPAHRLGWDAARREWFEWGVTLEAERFAWTRLSGPPSAETTAALLSHLPQLGAAGAEGLMGVLPDGFIVEVSPAAQAWWRQAAAALDAGKLVAIDYGLTADELLAPECREGTLRAYYQHRASSDVLARPGEQDITAHVNFTAIAATGERAGLTTACLQRQSQFLTAIAAQAWQDATPAAPWTAERKRQFQTLTHPAHLGQGFRVLVQSRGALDAAGPRPMLPAV